MAFFPSHQSKKTFTDSRWVHQPALKFRNRWSNPIWLHSSFHNCHKSYSYHRFGSFTRVSYYTNYNDESQKINVSLERTNFFFLLDNFGQKLFPQRTNLRSSSFQPFRINFKKKTFSRAIVRLRICQKQKQRFHFSTQSIHFRSQNERG